MRLDHIAYRVRDRIEAAKFICDAFGYRISDEFTIDFGNGEYAKSFALEPPEKKDEEARFSINIWGNALVPGAIGNSYSSVYHIAPEIFISDGTPNSVVGRWVEKHGPQIHHLAYSVDDVAETMEVWKQRGWATFTTDKPISNSNDLVQCFTNPHPLTGIVYEFIKRGGDNKGFNKDNVRQLMISSDNK